MDSYDVVVVGSGAGALLAAQRAAAAGLSTVVLERTDRLGGTSAYSGGGCWLPGTQVQQRSGVPDSTDAAHTYLRAVVPGIDEVRLAAFLETAPGLVAELEADDGFAFEWMGFPDYLPAPGRVPGGRSIQPVAVLREELPATIAALVRPPVERDRAGQEGRRRLTGGQALIARLAAMAVRDGAQIRTGHQVTELLVDGERVVGVQARTDAGPVTVRARRCVVLAAGGFERNAQLRRDRGVPGEAQWSMAPEGTNDGDVIDAAVAVGAATELLDQAWLCPGQVQADGRAAFTVGIRRGIMVDRNGRRYADEDLPYDQFGRRMAEHPDRLVSWLVYDDAEGGLLPALPVPDADPAAQRAAGLLVEAATLEDLAGLMGVDPAVLVAEVERFNQWAAAGEDLDFGRGRDEYGAFFTGGTTTLVPIGRAPFRAARFTLSDLGTKGGLVTDADAQVLRADGTPVAGLYACGNTAANLCRDVYPGPGIPLGTALVFAARAIAHCTREEPA